MLSDISSSSICTSSISFFSSVTVSSGIVLMKYIFSLLSSIYVVPLSTKIASAEYFLPSILISNKTFGPNSESPTFSRTNFSSFIVHS